MSTEIISDAEIAGYMNWRGPGDYTAAAERRVRRAIADCVRRERRACAGSIHDAARAAADNNDPLGYALLTALGDAILARGQA